MIDLWTEGEYVELKTQSKKLTYYFWREKAMKWWTQSFLMGIQNIIVGFRNEDGALDFIQPKAFKYDL